MADSSDDSRDHLDADSKPEKLSREVDASMLGRA
jgi:hypothetical protein